MSGTTSSIVTRDITMRFPQQQGWKALFKREPGKTALNGVTIEIPRGEIFGLLGPNGAGKTTLVKILTTLTIPTSGEAYVSGFNVVGNSLEVRRRVGVVYGDERAFTWRLSALDNLLFYAALYGIPANEARRRSMELLEMVGLGEAMHIRMHHYSSGMKQRASIARGLLNDPEVLILDEPTRSLDPLAAQELRQVVKDRVATAGRTVLIATNIMAEAEFLCDRIAFIDRGTVQMIGEIGYLRGVLQAEEVHQIVASGVTADELESLRAVPGVDDLKVIPSTDGNHRVEVQVQRDAAVVPALVRRIVESGGDVWSCGQRELSLEEMFHVVVARARTSAPERENAGVAA